MKALLARTFTAALVAAVTIGPASAALINVDVNDVDAPAKAGDFLTTGAVPLGAAGDFWNIVTKSGSTITATDLKASDGTTTTNVDLTVTGFNNDFDYNEGTAVRAPSIDDGNGGRDYIYHDLMGDYVFTTTTMTVTLSGLDDNTAYELVVYSHGNDIDQEGSINIITGTLNSGAASPKQTAFWTNALNPHDLTEDVDYVRFSNITPVGDEIAFTITGVGSDDAAAFNGLQLFIPEPSSLLLLGLGSLFVGARVHRPQPGV